MNKPFGLLTQISCDTVAETTDGLSDTAYRALWAAMSQAKPLRELIDIEESSPYDALGFNTPAFFWDTFSDEVKLELLAIAEKEEAEFRVWEAEFNAKYPPKDA